MENFLTAKIGPLPAWAWGGIVGVGGYLVVKRLGSQKQSSPVQVPVLDSGSLFGGSGTPGGGNPQPPNEPNPTPPEIITSPPQVPAPSTPTQPVGPGDYPACINATAGQYCIEHYTDAGGVYFAQSFPEVGLVPQGSQFWANLSQDYSRQIEQMPGFQLTPGGIKYFGAPPPGIQTYGFPLTGYGGPTQQNK